MSNAYNNNTLVVAVLLVVVVHAPSTNDIDKINPKKRGAARKKRRKMKAQIYGGRSHNQKYSFTIEKATKN
ncbi:MAG: hypothetical protein GY776_21725 [Alteromonas sp.]|nr:hypothetical protein [Alteromonas sp.]